MNLLSVLCDPRKDNYALYYSALLVLTIITIIPLNLRLTQFSFPIPMVLFAIGFFSLFMVLRNDKVGVGLLEFLKIHNRKKNFVAWQHIYSGKLSIPYEKLNYNDLNYNNNCEEPIDLLLNFIKEVTRRHKENMDWSTLDSFRKLNARVENLRVITYDE